MAVLLAACSSPKDASKRNFANVIDAKLASRCMAIGFSLNAATNSSTFPVSFALTQPGPLINAEQAAQMNERNAAQYEALTKVGLLSAEDAQVQPMFGSDKVPGKIYSLTEDGKKALKDPQHTVFCAGHYKVDDISHFTEPGVALGVTVSRVTYTYSPVNVPAWAKDDAVMAAFPDLTKLLAPKQVGNASLMLQNDGWAAKISSF